MAYRDLRDFIAALEAQGELVRVSEPVSTVLEMTEICTRLLAAGGPAVRLGSDGWAIYSQDGSLTAHFEFTVAITAAGPRVMTPWHRADGEEPLVGNMQGRARVT